MCGVYARAPAAHTKARDSYERESHVRNGRSPAETPSFAAAQTDESAYARASAAYTKARDSYERESHVRNGRSPAETPSFAAAQTGHIFYNSDGGVMR